MLAQSPAPIPFLVQQHADEAAMLRGTRSYLVGAPHVRLHELIRLDGRIRAHLDALEVAGELGARLAADALASPGVGEVFTATVRAIEDRNAVGLEKLLDLAESSEPCRAGVISAFGWVSAASLRGITRTLLESPHPFRRVVALAACALHQVDPGAAVTRALVDADASVRARALRLVADNGRVGLVPACLEALRDEDPRCVLEAARAAILLGERRAPMAALDAIASVPGPWRACALRLALKVQAPMVAREALKALWQDKAALRLLVEGTGISGDPHYLPWLVHQMQDPRQARLAGESFSAITGADLSKLSLDRPAPDDIESGPSEDPDDEEVAMDPDDGLPWPDPDKVAEWWRANGHRLAAGTRYFMGQPPSAAHCLSVLKDGFQRQRTNAAFHLCLLQPGTALFNTAAPAWRQQRWLSAMSA